MTRSIPQNATSAAGSLPWKPFPMNTLPKPLRNFVTEAATSIGCDHAMIGPACLAICGGVIGSSREVQVKEFWPEPPIFWLGVVAETASLKTPSLNLAMRPVRDLDREADAAHLANGKRDGAAGAPPERSRFSELPHWVLTDPPTSLTDDSDSWTDGWSMSPLRVSRQDNAIASGAPTTEPNTPKPSRVIVSDTTIEALCQVLQENPRGLVLHADELAGWLSSFNRFGKSGDLAHWLSIHSASPITIDRKSSKQPKIHIKRPAVSVVGGIQPAVLPRLMRQEFQDAGLLARFLLVRPPHRRRRWTDDEVQQSTITAYAQMVRRLRELKMPLDADGFEIPLPLKFSDGAA